MRRHAFTLIELLVVVAIIVALLAILLPSMGKALDVTHRAVCGSNLHQLHAGELAYASSHQGALPVSTPSVPSSSGVGIWAVYHRDASFAPYQGFVGLGLLYRGKVLDDGQLLYCPSSTHPLYQFDGSDYAWPSDNDLSAQQYYVAGSYHYRATYGATSASNYGRSMRITDPGTAAIMADGFARNTGSTALNAIPGVDTTHKDGYNVARLDGSVVFHDDPERIIADYALSQSWAGSSFVNFEINVWQDEFTPGSN